MCKNKDFLRTKPAFQKVVLSTLVLTLSTVGFASSAATAAVAPQAYPTFDSYPSSGAAGRDWIVNFISRDPTVSVINGDTRLEPPAGITVADIRSSGGNRLTARLSIPKGTQAQKIQLTFLNKVGDDLKVVAIADFDILAVGPGPVPPIGAAGVSKMWYVMPDRVVHSNFGHRIAGDYYGVLVEIQNYSGFDIQIVGVGFTRADKSKPINITSPASSRIMPNNMYRSTRGSLERQQEVGRRAVALNIIKALGNIYTGFLPFWKALGPKANAGVAGNIFNGPITAGFESVFPDTTVRQLVRLDDQTLRDGLVIKNGRAEKTWVFVPKRVLGISNAVAAAEEGNKLRTDRNRVDWKNDPEYVTTKLGDLVIEGDPVSYGQTIQIVSANEITPKTPPPTVTSVNPNSLKQGDEQDMVFIGASLQNATIGAPAGIEIPLDKITTDQNGFNVRAKVKVKATTPPGRYTITVSTPAGGSVAVPFTVEAKPN